MEKRVRGCIQGLPKFVGHPLSGTGKATDLKFCRNIHSVHRNKSPWKILGIVAVSVVREWEYRKFPGHPRPSTVKCIYRAPCTAIFAIAQLSHEVPHWLNISKFTRLRAVSRRQHGSSIIVNATSGLQKSLNIPFCKIAGCQCRLQNEYAYSPIQMCLRGLFSLSDGLTDTGFRSCKDFLNTTAESRTWATCVRSNVILCSWVASRVVSWRCFCLFTLLLKSRANVFIW